MTELVTRMRTCAAALLDERLSALSRDLLGRLHQDAADLLAEASNLLDEPEPLGDPMEVLTTSMGGIDRGPSAVWGGDLPAVAARPCPSCGSVDARTVRRIQRRLMLTCPICAHQWEYA
jgi:hypothetical protein